jgi:hypothetical protein
LKSTLSPAGLLERRRKSLALRARHDATRASKLGSNLKLMIIDVLTLGA